MEISYEEIMEIGKIINTLNNLDQEISLGLGEMVVWSDGREIGKVCLSSTMGDGYVFETEFPIYD